MLLSRTGQGEKGNKTRVVADVCCFLELGKVKKATSRELAENEDLGDRRNKVFWNTYG